MPGARWLVMMLRLTAALRPASRLLRRPLSLAAAKNEAAAAPSNEDALAQLVESYTFKELQHELKFRELRAAGKKQELKSRLEGALVAELEASKTATPMEEVIAAPAESTLDGYWTRHVEDLRRPAAQTLADRLAGNALGFPHESLEEPATGRKTLLLEALDWKLEHPTKVLLVRVGEFYEAWGVDAVLLVEHCGLNPMGDKVRAGCPWRNLQQTLDGLTRNGLTVAVYEERFCPDPRKKKLRYLAQVVMPGASTYVQGVALRANDVEWRADGPQFVAASVDINGATVVCLDVDARTAIVYDHLTPDGCRAAVSARGGAAAPAFFFDAQFKGSKAQETNRKNAAKRAALNLVDDRERLDDERAVRLEDPGSTEERVRVFAEAVAREILCVEDPVAFAREVRVTQPRTQRPLFASTARDVGLLDEELVPSLVPRLLPSRGARAASQRFLKRWLLAPPAEAPATAMRSLLAALLDESCPPLPLDNAPNLPRQKLVRLLAEKEANALLFRDAFKAAQACRRAVAETPVSISRPLLELLNASEAGGVFSLAGDDLVDASLQLEEAIAAVVTIDEEDAVSSSKRLPAAFLERNEGFRGVVQRDHRSEVRNAYEAVEAALRELDAAVAEGFAGEDVVYDVTNNVVCLRGAPSGDYVAPRDRFRQPLPRRRTTERASKACDAYCAACADAALVVRASLRALSEAVYSQHLDTAVACVAVCEAGAAALDHAEAARERGWALPVHGMDLRLTGLTPFWLDRLDATANDVCLSDGAVAFLTGPNASGKSTLLRSTAAAALLGASGLCAPVAAATVPHWDGILLRHATGDAPLYGKSSFEREMDAVAQLFWECSPKSLVLVDELGRGTSSTEGAAIGGAVLDELRDRKYRGVFATHLHEILTDDAREDVAKWRMVANHSCGAGVCVDSLALDAAMNADVPLRIVERAARILGRDVPVAQNSVEMMAAAFEALEAAAKTTPETVPQDCAPPPRLVGASCVYAFRTAEGVYVGETDSVRDRLKKHARTFGAFGDALVVRVADKSAARKAEALALRRLQALGVPLASSADAAHVHFGGA